MEKDELERPLFQLRFALWLLDTAVRWWSDPVTLGSKHAVVQTQETALPTKGLIADRKGARSMAKPLFRTL